MATQPREQERNEERQQRQRLNALIGNKVIFNLGAPDLLHLVQVRQLWDDRYRVNVLVGENAASAKVAHSYFLVVDGEGNIVVSTPKITKLY